MKKVSLILGAVLISGCIDLERAHAECFESGKCGAVDAGDITPDSGTPDSGMPDAGVVDTYDGGAPCTSSPNPKLKCDAPITLFAGGSSINNAALVALPDGFLAGWTSNGFDLHKVDMAGVTTAVHNEPIGITDGQLSLASKGSHWVATWMSDRATVIGCITSASQPGVVSLMPTGGGRMRNVQAAISSAGGVALAATDEGFDPRSGYDFTGCPMDLYEHAFVDSSTSSAAAAWTNAPLGDGFRFVYAGELGDLTNGDIDMVRQLADGGIDGLQVDVAGQPAEVRATGSHDGNMLLTAYKLRVGTPQPHNELHLLSTNPSLKGVANPVRVGTIEPNKWALATCGAGCTMTTALGAVGATHAPVSFFNDAPELRSLGTWDAVCSANVNAAISLAYSNGRIGVLYAQSSQVQLYLCDVPPMP